MRTSGKGWGRRTHQKKTGYRYRKEKKIQQTITIVCLLLSPTFLLHENKVRDQLCNKHVHRNDHCWRLPLGTCLGQWSLFTSLSYTFRYSPTKWRTYIYIYSPFYKEMPNLCHGSTNRRTCIHYCTCWCDNYTTARQTDVHVFTISLLQPQARTFLTSWQLQGRKRLNQHCGHFNNTGSCWSGLGRVKIENVVMSTTPVLTSPANAGQGWKELNQHSGHVTNLARDCP